MWLGARHEDTDLLHGLPSGQLHLTTFLTDIWASMEKGSVCCYSLLSFRHELEFWFFILLVLMRAWRGVRAALLRENHVYCFIWMFAMFLFLGRRVLLA